MSGALVLKALLWKELQVLLRNRTAVALGLALIVVVLAAAALGRQRSERIAIEREGAERTDQQVWLGQGERNPHAAGHFSRYAFKSFPFLSGFDPGVADFAGLAVWMEAHVQSPAVFRRAEDNGDGLRMGSVTPAWILQVIAPLFIFVALHATVAGEREDGTLRQLSATGVRGISVICGKLAASGIALGSVLVPAVLAAVLIAAPQEAGAVPDPWLRTTVLVAAYTAYFIVIALVAIGISSLFRQRRSALLALVAFWVVGTVLAPRLGADVAVRLFPEPTAEAFRKGLAEAGDPNWNDPEFLKQEKARVLARYGVDRVEALPFNYAGLQLQRSEERASPRFQAFYGGLNRRQDRQERVLRLVSLASPALALSHLSAGLSATDRLHHRTFVDAAEAHRRRIMKQLNTDIRDNAGAAGYDYIADASLWRTVESFRHASPAFTPLARHYLPSVAVLLSYLAAGFCFALWAFSRAVDRSARA